MNQSQQSELGSLERDKAEARLGPRQERDWKAEQGSSKARIKQAKACKLLLLGLRESLLSFSANQTEHSNLKSN